MQKYGPEHCLDGKRLYAVAESNNKRANLFFAHIFNVVERSAYLISDFQLSHDPLRVGMRV